MSGSDYNNGLSPVSPLKTVAELVVRDTTSPLAYWCLAGNLHEQVTIPRNNMTVGWCGWGTRPTIDASDPIPAASWSLTSGKTKTYQATISPAIAASKTQVWSWENGAVLTQQTSIANVEANAGSFYASADTGTPPITLYIHPTGDTDPTSDGKIREITMRQHAVTSRDVTGATIQGVWAKRALSQDGSVIVGRNSTLKNSLVTEGGNHNVFMRAGATAQNVEALDSVYQAGGATLFVYFEDDAAAAGANFIDTWAHTTTYSGTATVYGYYGHRGTGANWGTITYTRAKATNVYKGFADGSHTTAYTMTSPVLSGSIGIGLSLGGVINIAGGTVIGTVDPIYVGLGANYTISGADISGGVTAAIHGYATGANASVTVTNSTIHNSPYAVSFETDNAYSLSVQHSTIRNISQRYYNNHIMNALVLDYNAYDNPNLPLSPNWTYYGTYTAYKAAGVYDQHSTP